MYGPLKSAVSTSPQIPKTIFANGTPIDVGDLLARVDVTPVPGFPQFGQQIVTYGPMLLVAWVDIEFQRVTHLRITNTILPGAPAAQASLKVNSDVDDPLAPAYVLEPQAAIAWTSGEWLRTFSFVGTDTALDKHLRTRVETDQTDPDRLQQTGSGNKCFFEPATSEWDDAPSEIKLVYLDARARKSARRCRNLIEPLTGLPWGMLASFASSEEAKAHATGVLAEANKKFSTQATNLYGLNAWDEDHADGTEEHRLFRLTGHPVYLADQLNLYYAMRELGDYVHKNTKPTPADEKNYLHCGGAPRKLGWWLEILAYTLDSVTSAFETAKYLEQSTALFESVLVDLHSDIAFALDSLKIHQGLPGGFAHSISGSVPNEMKDLLNPMKPTLPHIVKYQFPVIAWGLFKLKRAFQQERGYSLEPILDEILKEQLLLCLDCLVEVGGVPMVISYQQKDDSWKVALQPINGTSLWHAPWLIEYGSVGALSTPAARVTTEILAKAKNLGAYWVYSEWSYAAPLKGGTDFLSGDGPK